MSKVTACVGVIDLSQVDLSLSAGRADGIVSEVEATGPPGQSDWALCMRRVSLCLENLRESVAIVSLSSETRLPGFLPPLSFYGKYRMHFAGHGLQPSHRGMYAEVIVLRRVLAERQARYSRASRVYRIPYIGGLYFVVTQRKTLYEAARSSSQFTGTGDHPALRRSVCRAWRRLHEHISMCLHAQRCRKHILRCVFGGELALWRCL